MLHVDISHFWKYHKVNVVTLHNMLEERRLILFVCTLFVLQVRWREKMRKFLDDVGSSSDDEGERQGQEKERGEEEREKKEIADLEVRIERLKALEAAEEKRLELY